MGALYQISFPNGKRYVGMTMADTHKRFWEHRYHAKRWTKLPIYDALRKYGDTAEFTVLAIADNREYLEVIERNAIRIMETKLPQGYNLTDGGDGAPMGNTFQLGRKRSLESRTKMSASSKGKKKSDSHREAIRAALIGNKYAAGLVHSAEQNKKCAISNRKSRGASSGILGVSWHKTTKKWRAHLTLNYKFIDLGYHDTKEDAALARKKGESIYFYNESSA